MKKTINWSYLDRVMIEKPDKKYVKNIELVKDNYGLTREIGEIDFDAISKKELEKVFSSTFLLEYGDENYKSYETMEKFGKAVKEYYGMSEHDLLLLFKEYLTKNKDLQKYGNFIKLLKLTCRLDYRDFDGNVYSNWDEHPHPLQSEVKHDYVGSYQLVMLKPFPLRIIEAMKKRIVLIDKEEKDKQIADFDKKYSLQDLDEIEERI